MSIRIQGINLPNKRSVIALTYLYGVGKSSSRKILKQASIDENKSSADWSSYDIKKIQEVLKKYTIEGELRERVNMAIKRLKDIRSYRGRRHVARMPVRGQHTKNNTRTLKGKRKSVVRK